MKLFKCIIFFTFLLIGTLAGCNSTKSNNTGTDLVTFPTREEAVTYFIKENAGNNMEWIKTTEGDEIIIKGTGNHQYSAYGIKNETNGYSVAKHTATLSLHNTIAGGAELTTRNGNDYTFYVVKHDKLDELSYETRTRYEFLPIFSGEAALSLTKGHVLGKDNSASQNAIQSTESIAVSG